MKAHEAQALITAAQVYLQRYKGANAALKEAKAALEQYMDDARIDNIDGTEEGSGARFVSRSDRVLLLAEMPDDMIIWAARLGVLKGTVSAFDELPDEQRNVLTQYIGKGAGTRYVDIYFPPWGSRKQAKKEAARAETSAAPLPAPTPTRAPPKAAAAVTPISSADLHQPEADMLCPQHPTRTPKPSQYGGTYCTARDDINGNANGYCTWRSQQAA